MHSSPLRNALMPSSLCDVRVCADPCADSCAARALRTRAIPQVSVSLRKLNLSSNRLCGVWSDAYGGQQFGTYDQTGAEVVADLLRTREGSTLTHLDISSNGLGPVGGRALYEALRENDKCPLRLLDVRLSRFDAPTESFLHEIAGEMKPPLNLAL